MKASVGDHIVVASPAVDGPVRDGEIVELRNRDGSPPYVVRWSDSGTPGCTFPAWMPTCGPAHEREPPRSHLTCGPGDEIDLFETGDETAAHAVLLAEARRSTSRRVDWPSAIPLHRGAPRSATKSPWPGRCIGLADRLLEVASEASRTRRAIRPSSSAERQPAASRNPTVTTQAATFSARGLSESQARERLARPRRRHAWTGRPT